MADDDSAPFTFMASQDSDDDDSDPEWQPPETKTKTNSGNRVYKFIWVRVQECKEHTIFPPYSTCPRGMCCRKICYSQISTVFFPCKHAVYCLGCLQQKQPINCPTCGQNINFILFADSHTEKWICMHPRQLDPTEANSSSSNSPSPSSSKNGEERDGNNKPDKPTITKLDAQPNTSRSVRHTAPTRCVSSRKFEPAIHLQRECDFVGVNENDQFVWMRHDFVRQIIEKKVAVDCLHAISPNVPIITCSGNIPFDTIISTSLSYNALPTIKVLATFYVVTMPSISTVAVTDRANINLTPFFDVLKTRPTNCTVPIFSCSGLGDCCRMTWISNLSFAYCDSCIFCGMNGKHVRVDKMNSPCVRIGIKRNSPTSASSIIVANYAYKNQQLIECQPIEHVVIRDGNILLSSLQSFRPKLYNQIRGGLGVMLPKFQGTANVELPPPLDEIDEPIGDGIDLLETTWIKPENQVVWIRRSLLSKIQLFPTSVLTICGDRYRIGGDILRLNTNRAGSGGVHRLNGSSFHIVALPKSEHIPWCGTNNTLYETEVLEHATTARTITGVQLPIIIADNFAKVSTSVRNNYFKLVANDESIKTVDLLNDLTADCVKIGILMREPRPVFVARRYIFESDKFVPIGKSETLKGRYRLAHDDPYWSTFMAHKFAKYLAHVTHANRRDVTRRLLPLFRRPKLVKTTVSSTTTNNNVTVPEHDAVSQMLPSSSSNSVIIPLPPPPSSIVPVYTAKEFSKQLGATLGSGLSHLIECISFGTEKFRNDSHKQPNWMKLFTEERLRGMCTIEFKDFLFLPNITINNGHIKTAFDDRFRFEGNKWPEMVWPTSSVDAPISKKRASPESRDDDCDKKIVKRRKAGLCCVCMDNEADAVFLPCNHLCCCYDTCAKLLTKCPTCRETIDSTLKIYNNSIFD